MLSYILASACVYTFTFYVDASSAQGFLEKPQPVGFMTSMPSISARPNAIGSGSVSFYNFESSYVLILDQNSTDSPRLVYRFDTQSQEKIRIEGDVEFDKIFIWKTNDTREELQGEGNSIVSNGILTLNASFPYRKLKLLKYSEACFGGSVGFVFTDFPVEGGNSVECESVGWFDDIKEENSTAIYFSRWDFENFTVLVDTNLNFIAVFPNEAPDFEGICFNFHISGKTDIWEKMAVKLFIITKVNNLNGKKLNYNKKADFVCRNENVLSQGEYPHYMTPIQ